MTEYKLFLYQMNYFIKKLEKLKKKRRHMSLARMSQKKVIFFYKSEEINSNWSTQCFIR